MLDVRRYRFWNFFFFFFFWTERTRLVPMMAIGSTRANSVVGESAPSLSLCTRRRRLPALWTSRQDLLACVQVGRRRQQFREMKKHGSTHERAPALRRIVALYDKWKMRAADYAACRPPAYHGVGCARGGCGKRVAGALFPIARRGVPGLSAPV